MKCPMVMPIPRAISKRYTRSHQLFRWYLTIIVFAFAIAVPHPNLGRRHGRYRVGKLPNPKPLSSGIGPPTEPARAPPTRSALANAQSFCNTREVETLLH